jgi:chromosome segregation ATPase
MNPRSLAAILPSALLLLLAGCAAADSLLYEPKPEDPLDGYTGSLQQAGVNTEMDWGPKQDLLLGEFKTLKEDHARLQKDLDKVRAENQNLKARLDGEGKSLAGERTLRAQAEAEVRNLQQKRRELEARILSLSIEKAKLEQQSLLGRIAELQKIVEAAPAPVEAAAPAAGKR